MRCATRVLTVRFGFAQLLSLLLLCATHETTAQETADTSTAGYRFGPRISGEAVRFELSGSATMPDDSSRVEVSNSAVGFLIGIAWIRMIEGQPWRVSMGLNVAFPFVGALRMPSFSTPLGIGLGFDLGSRFRTDFELTPEFAYYTFQTDTLEWTFRDASLSIGVSAGVSYRISDSKMQPRLQLMAGVSMGLLRSVTYNHNGTLLDVEMDDGGKFVKLPSVRLSYQTWFP